MAQIQIENAKAGSSFSDESSHLLSSNATHQYVSIGGDEIDTWDDGSLVHVPHNKRSEHTTRLDRPSTTHNELEYDSI